MSKTCKDGQKHQSDSFFRKIIREFKENRRNGAKTPPCTTNLQKCSKQTKSSTENPTHIMTAHSYEDILESLFIR